LRNINSSNHLAGVVFFCLIMLGVICDSLFNPNRRTYFSLRYGGNSELNAVSKIIMGSYQQIERMMHIFDAFMDEVCGPEGAIIWEAVKTFVESVLDIIGKLFTVFKVLFGLLKQLVDMIERLLLSVFIPIDLDLVRFVRGRLGKVVAFGIPGVGLGALLRACYVAVADKTDLGVPTLLFALWMSAANILTQFAISSLVGSIASWRLPFLSFQFDVAHDYYASMACSVLLLFACVSAYVGAILRPQNEL
jgi:phage-related protein